MQKSIILSQEFDVPINDLWLAITERDQMIKWYFDMIPDFKALVGFKTKFTVHHNNLNYIHLWEVTEVVPDKRIIYNWKYEGYSGDSYVEWNLKSVGEKTHLTFSHHILESFPENNSDFSEESCRKGWEYFIQNRLKEYLKKNRGLNLVLYFLIL